MSKQSVTLAIPGVPCSVTAPPAALAWLGDIYTAFSGPSPEPVGYSVRLEPDGAGWMLADSAGLAEHHSDDLGAVRALTERIAEVVPARLAEQGVYAIHAAALRHGEGALILPGASGAGKTTLALGLLGRGLQLLSDELALTLPDARTIAPYRRTPQLRPGTPELFAGLGFLLEREPADLGAGRKWPLLPDELEQTFPGCLGEAAPLRHIVLLGEVHEGASMLEPVATGIAAVELARMTAATAGSPGLKPVLERMARLVEGCRIARLRRGSLESSLDAVAAWLQEAA
jgi:hypothetical protein